MTDADDQLLRQRAAGMRVLALAILLGAVTIVAVFVGLFYIGFGGKPVLGAPPAGVPVVTLIGFAIALLSLVASAVLPDRIKAAVARRPPVGGSGVPQFVAAYSSSFIVGTALAEGAAILGAIFFLIEGHWLSLVPAGLGILALIWRFPTEAGLRDWVEGQLAERSDRPADAGV